MRKFLLFAFLLFCALNLKAQDRTFLRHWAVGVFTGTTGVGLDVATSLSPHLQIRGAISFPRIPVSSDLMSTFMPDLPEGFFLPDDIKVEGKLNMNSAEVLLDAYPSKRSSFHLTLGLSFGYGKGVAELYNISGQEELKLVYAYNHSHEMTEKVGYGMGDYLLEPDAQGNLYADIRVRKIKPYVGVGFGRAVPKGKRVGFMFELGARFWGSPSVYCNQVRLNQENAGGDEGKIFKIISELSVYPVVRLRLCGRLL